MIYSESMSTIYVLVFELFCLPPRSSVEFLCPLTSEASPIQRCLQGLRSFCLLEKSSLQTHVTSFPWVRKGREGGSTFEGGGVMPKHGTEEGSPPVLGSNCWNTVSSCLHASALALYIPPPFLYGNQITLLLSPDSSHGFHFIPNKKLCVQSLSHVWLFCNPMDCSPSGSSVHEIFQARTLEWVAISSSRGSSRPRDQICISCVSYIGRQIHYCCATQEAPFHLIPNKWWVLISPNAFISCPLQAAVLPSSICMSSSLGQGVSSSRYPPVHLIFYFIFYLYAKCEAHPDLHQHPIFCFLCGTKLF